MAQRTRTVKSYEDRFWSRVDIREPDECWPWTRGTSMGYGMMRVGGAKHRTHRLAYFYEHGSWPKLACHHCDNPLCCNPRHIYNGTHSTNIHDRVDRHPQSWLRGERAAGSRLTAVQVREIRARRSAGETIQSIAVDFGISSTHVSRIARRLFWRHIP